MARLQTLYTETIAPALHKELGCNSMQVPRLKKITLNMGLGEAVGNKKIIESATKDLAAITGQKPVVTISKKSVAGFKIRDGWPIGAMVTLRRNSMYEFLDRLISIAIPRVRDFRGLSPKSFDGRGNYSFGLQEQIVFPEIDYDKVDALRGMDITLTISATNDDAAKKLLRAFNFPLRS